MNLNMLFGNWPRLVMSCLPHLTVPRRPAPSQAPQEATPKF